MLFQQESYLHHSSYNYNTHTHTLFNPQNAIKHLTSRQDLNHYQEHFSPPTTRFRHFVFPTCTATFTIPLSLFTQFLPSLVPLFRRKRVLTRLRLVWFLHRASNPDPRLLYICVTDHVDCRESLRCRCHKYGPPQVCLSLTSCTFVSSPRRSRRRLRARLTDPCPSIRSDYRLSRLSLRLTSGLFVCS